MLTFKEFKAQWAPREQDLRQSYGTDAEGEHFWHLAYRQYTRNEGLATIHIVPDLEKEGSRQLTLQEFKARWANREADLREGYHTELKGDPFWNQAYRQYTRLQGLATIQIVPNTESESRPAK